MHAVVSSDEQQPHGFDPYAPDGRLLYDVELDLRARDNFFLFRKRIHPDFIWGEWWAAELSVRLQHFLIDLVQGKRPWLAIAAPPQHGKSAAIIDMCAFIAGRFPQLNTVFASYGQELGVRTNLAIQRILLSQSYQHIFPEVAINQPGWQCNTSLIEWVNQKGSFRNTTVEGQITGFGLHCGVIDDPIKGRQEAQSDQTRNKTWSWLVDDFIARFDAAAGMLFVMTSWHPDDPLGRMEQHFRNRLKVVRYPAIADYKPDGRRNWRDRRALGEALFPEFKPKHVLIEDHKSVMTEASWEAQYQQNPFIAGNVLPVNRMLTLPKFAREQVVRSIRYWDKAGTAAAFASRGSAYTAGVLMHLLDDGRYVIEHIKRGHWSAAERETVIEQLSRLDSKRYGNYRVYVEQEPGSGGKESAENTIRRLAGLSAYADRVTGAKEVRAEPFIAQVQNGGVSLVAGEWVYDWMDEAAMWPNGKHKDQVDAAAGAFAKLMADDYDYDYKGWN